MDVPNVDDAGGAQGQGPAPLTPAEMAAAGLDDVLPPGPYNEINRRWHSGAKISAEEVGELLDLVLDRHLLARRLAALIPDATRPPDQGPSPS